jgi:hypothetical protein
MKDYILIPISILLTLCVYLLFRSFGTLENINSRLDRANVEYQFVVTDTIITVYDANRIVGSVKLEGQLDSLIIADNE